jgi:hypothetical protein
MRKNPFNYGKPVQTPENFFGREEEINSIYQQILALNSISLVGERKMGRTSLLLHLVHPQVRAKYHVPEDIKIFYIDISSCSFLKSSDVFRRFLECIYEEAAGDIKREVNSLLEKEYIHFRRFEDIIKKIKNNGQEIVFLLDEFENISMIRQSDIFLKLRYLAQFYDVVFVISTLHDLAALFHERRFSPSPFFNIFTKHQLQGLDVSASHELIRVNFGQEGFNIDLLAIDSIMRFSGTNPFFLKLACFFYFEMAMKGQTAFDSHLKTLVQEKLEPYHKYNWDHLSRNEQAALLSIIYNGNTDDPPEKRSLERKGYIAKGKDGPFITSESFHNYLKDIHDSRYSSLDGFKALFEKTDTQHNLTESDRNALEKAASEIEELKFYPRRLNVCIYGFIGYFELEMRKYIKNALEIALGTAWFRDALDITSREEIEARISKEKRAPKSFRYPENPLDYAKMENLRDLILHLENWNCCFSKYFEDKIAFETKMEKIIELRNRIAHYRSIHFNEVVDVIQDIVWMFTRIRKQL